MRIIIVPDYDALSWEAARIIKSRIEKKPDLVLGLATGDTPLGVYEKLIQLHREEYLDFSKVITFNLDEYVGLGPKHPQSYHYYLWNNFFRHINIKEENIYILRGDVKDLKSYCEWYEQKIKEVGGIDLQLLGIGRDGHVGFNEPGSSLYSRTRVKTLTQETIEDNARFFKKREEVPRYAITMGIKTIWEARECMLLASGPTKADAVRDCIEGPISASMPASFLQFHPRATIILDEQAANKLCRKGYYKHSEKLQRELESS